MSTCLLMRPGRMSAGSSFSGWLVVMMTMRLGESTTPSSTLSSPARSSLSSISYSLSYLLTVLITPLSAALFSTTTTFSSSTTSASSTTSPSSGTTSGAGARTDGLLEGRSNGVSAALLLREGRCSPSCACDAPRVTLVVTVVVVASGLGARRWTTLEAASTSSITKITFLKVRATEISESSSFFDLLVLTHRKLWSNMTSISSWLVLIFESGTETMCRLVWCAIALISDVFPVPGGP
mmetsp:Transcript_47619/g.117902  ORF Transcript_47619/g.117902 Transcript_47619/m.117902 type:complete len:238 (-) Transcript_47619:945-1658(-)